MLTFVRADRRRGQYYRAFHVDGTTYFENG